MTGFFTEGELEEFRKVFLSVASDWTSIYKNESIDFERIIREYVREWERGLSFIDIILLNQPDEIAAELIEAQNKGKVIKIINQWAQFPQVDSLRVAQYLINELPLDLKSDGERITGKLDTLLKDITAAASACESAQRFPFLFDAYQEGYMLTSDSEAIASFKPGSDFLKRLSLEDIATGNIDFAALRNITGMYSPFLPALLTLANIEKMNLPEGYAYFPIVNHNFPGIRRYDFRGIIEVIPLELFDIIASLDHRHFEFFHVGSRLKDFLICCLMTGRKVDLDKFQKGTIDSFDLAIQFAGKLKEGDYDFAHYIMGRNILLNAGSLLHAEEVRNTAYDDLKDIETSLIPLIKAAALKSYIKLPNGRQREAAKELSLPGFLVAYSYMRQEQNYLPQESIMSADNRMLNILDIGSNNVFGTETLPLYIGMSTLEIASLIKEGMSCIKRAGKFYSDHKDFFQRLTDDPNEVDLEEEYDILSTLRESVTDKKLEARIEDWFNSIDSLTNGVMAGRFSEHIFHYISARLGDQKVKPIAYQGGNEYMDLSSFFPNGTDSSIIITEADILSNGNFLLGYGMQNCVKVLDMLRYATNPEAQVYVMWHKGMKICMSYELNMGNHDGQKDHLIDSIELSDLFFKNMKPVVNEIGEYAIVERLVDLYLSLRLAMSEKGLYVLPSSNDMRVKLAMMEFVNHHNAEKVLGYSGTKVKTDTDFENMPYFVPKTQVVALEESIPV
jgi:hypothetical protein